MEISTSSNSVTISGNIKTIGDFQTIKSTLDAISSKYQEIILNIVDSLSITSSIIGYLNKLVLKDNIELHINIGNDQLLELFDDLNLSTVFDVKKI